LINRPVLTIQSQTMRVGLKRWQGERRAGFFLGAGETSSFGFGFGVWRRERERLAAAWQMTSPCALFFLFLFFHSTPGSCICFYTVEIMDTEVDIAPENLFRPAKRRKFARRRQDDPEEATSAAAESVAESTDKAPGAPESRLSDDADDSTHATGVVRLRRPKATRKGGIGFSATPRPSGKDDNRQTALSTVEDQDKETIRAMDDRFQMYTGQAEDVDRHMYELYAPLATLLLEQCGLTR
jgi:hypothetical protein